MELEMVKVFTNGAFDVLHRGHIQYLKYARSLGDRLIVGLNSDCSIKRYKGDSRPINTLADRAYVLLALECVDEVVPFYEDEPLNIIKQIRPDILIKGGDWQHYVCGREFVESYGGKVVLYPYIKGHSSTRIINELKKQNNH